MSKTRKSDVEVFVHKKQEAIIVCPQCKLEKVVDTQKIKTLGHWGVNASCKRCGHVFSISFNFRKYYRKSTSLTGYIFTDADSNEAIAEIDIYDISLTGVGFRFDSIQIQKGSIYTLRFLLDDPEQNAVEKEIMVESVRGEKAGASFLNKTFDKVLNQYILSK